MNAEIICVGTELLLGNIVNTNATYLSQKLSELGINVYFQTVVGDNSVRLADSMQTALGRSDVIILTGGLGPTADDLTKEIVAKSLGLSLVEDEESRASIDRFFAAQNRTPVQSNYKQCLAPEGAVVLANTVGTAPGYCIDKDNKRIIMLPGPPKELKVMFENLVYPYLRSISDSQLVSHYIRIFGVGESKTEELLGELTGGENPTVATYAGDGEVMVRVTAKAADSNQAEALCKPIIEKIKDIFKENIYAIDSDGLDKAVVASLRAKNLTVATAESCTGGMVAQKITSVPGSSTVFKAGVIAYSNEIKYKELDISEDILKEHGAVSKYTAAHMAINVRKKENADLGIGITGVAGPDRSEGKDVGLVFVALADKDKIWVRRLHLSVGYDRDKIRNYATSTALDLIRRYVCFLPDVMPGFANQGDEIITLEAQPTNSEKPLLSKREPVISLKEAALSDQEMLELMSNTFDDGAYEQDEASYDYKEDNDTSISLFSNDTKKEKIKHTPKTFKDILNTIKTSLLNALPNRNNSIRDNILKSLFIVSLAGLIISASFLLNYFVTGNNQKNLLEDTRKLWYSAQQTENEQKIDFSPLLEVNKDTKAWLKIEGTSIDNPVVQAKDNNQYLNRNFSGKKSRYGTLFFDYRDIISESGNSQNLVIYGHNMKDGSMFAGLLKYKNLNFYKQYPTFKLTTLHRQSNYQVFSVFLINANAKHDNGYIYNFLRNSFTDQEEFLSWVEEAKKRSLINTNVDIYAGDEIVTLVTCAYDFDDARLVVMGKRIQDDNENIIDTSGAVYNPSPMYPQIWYDNRGLKNPYKNNPVPTVPSTSTDVSYEAPMSSTTEITSSAESDETSHTSTPVGTVSSTPSNSSQTSKPSEVSKPTSSTVSGANSSSATSSIAQTASEVSSVNQSPSSSDASPVSSEEATSSQ